MLSPHLDIVCGIPPDDICERSYVIFGETKMYNPADFGCFATDSSVLGDEEYDVKKILDHRSMVDDSKYLVRWKGYGPNDDSWEPSSSLSCPTKVQQYYRRKRLPVPSVFAVSYPSSPIVYAAGFYDSNVPRFDPDPCSFHEAITHPAASEWRKA